MRAELDPDVTAAWLVWMAERGLSKLVAGVPDAQVERRVRALADILWFTLYGEC